MKLGLQPGYWPGQSPAGHAAPAREAERLGFESVWTGESWGSDAFTPLSCGDQKPETLRSLAELFL